MQSRLNFDVYLIIQHNSHLFATGEVAVVILLESGAMVGNESSIKEEWEGENDFEELRGKQLR